MFKQQNPSFGIVFGKVLFDRAGYDAARQRTLAVLDPRPVVRGIKDSHRTAAQRHLHTVTTPLRGDDPLIGEPLQTKGLHRFRHLRFRPVLLRTASNQQTKNRHSINMQTPHSNIQDSHHTTKIKNSKKDFRRFYSDLRKER